MSANVFKKKANDPTAAVLPAQDAATQPQDTTQDQINEMESEGQAMKQGQKSRPSSRRTHETVARDQKPQEQKGAVEGDHRLDKEPGNKNAVGALDKNGLPKNKKAIAEDSIGARADETQG